MKATVKFKDKVLSGMILNTLRTYFTNYTITEKSNTILVTNQNKETVKVSIVNDEILIENPRFKYRPQLITLLFFVGALPLNLAGFFSFPFLFSLIQFFLPSIVVLAVVYYKTHNTQYKKFQELSGFYKQIESCIIKAYKNSIVK